MDGFSLTSQMADSLESQATQAVSRIIGQLIGMRRFLFDMDQTEIKLPKNLAPLRTELRDILIEIDTSPDINLIVSTDAVLTALRPVRNNLDLATDLLNQSPTGARRKPLYQIFGEICIDLKKAIEALQNTKIN
jgi:hypothetical protein